MANIYMLQFGENALLDEMLPRSILLPFPTGRDFPINIFLMDLRSAQIGLDIYPEVECPSKRIFHLGSLQSGNDEEKVI